MNTKRDEILAAALSLFNSKGIDGVTARDIAKKASMSVGNLTYYFPSKNDIIMELARLGGEAINAAIFENKPARNSLIFYYNQMKIIFTEQQKYKFFVHKRYAEVITSLPGMQKETQAVFRLHFGFWKELNERLVKEKLAKPLLIAETNTHTYMINILALFWHQEFLIFFPELSDEQKVQRALTIYFQAYKPYLTKKGLNELGPLLKELKPY